MADMKFKFTIQQYQTDAVESVIKVFAGQPFHDKINYRRDTGTQGVAREIFDNHLSDDELLMGFANAPVTLDQSRLLENIKNVQRDNNIKESSALSKHMGACSLDVEMETGTGKTYVYIKTMFGLNKQYGWSKFIVVVPSIAIREGVQKSFQTMEDHFMSQYGKKARFFVYNSKNLTDIDNFSSSADMSVMIINVQAFNARGKDARRIRMELDEFGSRKPIDVIRANRPIVILDEPQKMGGEKTQESLKEFGPLFILNYSATHKEHHDLVYVLDALDAYQKKLVKKIEVKGFEIKNLSGTDSYLCLENIVLSANKPPKALLNFEIKYDKGVKRETRSIGVDDDLYSISKNMDQYDGYHVNDIDPVKGTLSFTNGIEIQTGQVHCNVDEAEEEKTIRRIQIRETIRSHFEKERELFEKGIKTLSLFFIDKVENYRKYDQDGNEVNSEYGDMFEEEYNSILSEILKDSSVQNSPYGKYLSNIDVHSTHAGYFSIDKKGHKVDSSLKRGTDISDDESAYELILKDKEKLLSLDNPVRFIFSHSALREGWDNPNIFQICTLKQGGDSTTNKRQEVGRGLRLCVNQNGERQDSNVLGEEVQEINKLTVITSEGYTKFVESLQNEIKSDLYERPTKASMEYFEGKQFKVGNDTVTLTKEQAHGIYRYLVKNDYIDEDDHVTDKYRDEGENHAPLPDKNNLRDYTKGIHDLIKGIYDEHALDGMIVNGNTSKIVTNEINHDNFYKKEFQTLWNYINHKYTYTVHFDSKELIDKAIKHIDEKLYVARLQYTVTQGEQSNDWSADKIKSRDGFVAEKSQTNNLQRAHTSQVKYDLIGKIGTNTHLTRRTVTAILKAISPDKFKLYQENPEEFISRVSQLINEEKATMIVDAITYNEVKGTYDTDIFTAEKNIDVSRALDKKITIKKHVMEHLIVDGTADMSIEAKFAQAMEQDDKVVVYAKLPRGFQIPTPVGHYAPDWAICF